MINGVTIYGGFPSGGGTLADRDPNQYETILSGDIGTPGAISDNCYHVFYHPGGLNLDESAVLDGFTITASRANGSGGHNSGGGMYNGDSSPTVKNCIFRGNSASGEGGGMSGGAGSVTDCTFIGNSGSNGGAIGNSNARFVNCLITDNSANKGGGMYNWNSHPTVINCTISGNSGSGMYNWEVSNPTVINCTFSGNSGSGMVNIFSWPTVIGCAFTGNSANNYGGGMFNYEFSHPTVINCTFTGNSADYGGGMGNYQSDGAIVTNCIFWGNAASSGDNEIYNNTSFQLYRNCDIAGSGGSGGGWDGSLGIDQGGNIDADPLFVDSDGPDNTPGTEDDDLRLMRFSPCIETGDYAAVPADTEDIDDDGNTGELVPWDLDRRPRIADGDCKVPALVDMGAYEFTLKFDLSDFAVFALHWAETGCDAGNGWCGSADMDRIDDVDDKDLRCFAEHWLLGLGL